TSNVGASAPWFSVAFTPGRPHTMTATLKNIHGIQARATLCVGRACPAAAPPSGSVLRGGAKADRASTGAATSADSHASRGCHTRQKAASAAIDARPPAMSTSSTPTKLLQTNWTIAKVPPQTSTAGQTDRSPRQPLIVTTSQAGTTSDTNGSWRPAIMPSVEAGMSVTAASVRIGVPIAPKATGAVLAISERAAAYSGVKPRPISNAEQIATGVPKPD